MSIEDVFTVRLFVKDEPVAESTDVELWQAVFAKISGGSEKGAMASAGILSEGLLPVDDSVAKFANKIGIDVSILRSACDPQQEEPYLHLDLYCWAEWTKNIPKRGPKAISTIATATTLLCLWFQSAGLGNPILQQSLNILSNIGAEKNNPARSIKNCPWLQLRGGKTLQLNPAAIEQAVEVAKAFCEKRAPDLTSK